MRPLLPLVIVLALATPAFAAPAGTCEPGEDALASFARSLRDVSELSLSRTRSPLRAEPASGGETFRWIGVELEDDTLVDGSWSIGGTQPDFWIDHDDPALREAILEPARAIAKRESDPWKRIAALQKLVQKTLRGDGHRNRGYIRHNERMLADGDHIASLGEYVDLRAGVCRENALLTTVALREAGFDARFAYFEVKDGRTVRGDHGLALVEIDGVTWVVDSFKPFGETLNGHRLSELIDPPRNHRYHPSPLADGNVDLPIGTRLTPNDFPRARSARVR